MKIVVSACLMGESCKYNGLDNYHRELVEACERTGTEVLLVCPEVFGGLPTPRKPSEIVNGEVRTCEGTSVACATAPLVWGALGIKGNSQSFPQRQSRPY